MNKSYKTPILFIVFNRPDHTKKAFEVIKNLQPEKLYVAGDGPREGVKGERKKIEDTRAIFSKIDWHCNFHSLLREKNLGCKKAVSGAVDWFFENEKQGVIIEDDCVLDPSFFPYCEELLEKYADDERVMTIGAENVQPERRTTNSYYFSQFMHCWGWASWRRAWEHYDVEMKTWPASKKQDKLLGKIFDEPKAIQYWTKVLDDVYKGKVDTWDRQWQYAIWENGGVNIIPEVNLVSNIGFGKEATHTKNRHTDKAELPTETLEFPLIHPEEIQVHKQADQYTQSNHFRVPLYRKIYQKLKGIIQFD